MSDSVRPHRQQSTRLPHPWESPGKDTRVGCHFLLQCMKVKSEREVTQSCLTLRDPTDCSLLGSSVHGIFQARVLEWGVIALSVPWRRAWQSTAVFLPRESHGQRSLAGYRPRSCKESDMTEVTEHTVCVQDGGQHNSLGTEGKHWCVLRPAGQPTAGEHVASSNSPVLTLHPSHPDE